jgi:tRNA (guanine37-N1)-methyltransferase
MEVPAELLSGNHEEIEKLRFLESVRRTAERRPDLLRLETFSAAEKKFLRRHKLYDTVQEIQQKQDRGRQADK